MTHGKAAFCDTQHKNVAGVFKEYTPEENMFSHLQESLPMTWNSKWGDKPDILRVWMY